MEIDNKEINTQAVTNANANAIADNQKPITSSDKEKVGITSQKKKQQRIFKIIVIGDSNVGKTCLTFRFCTGRFPTKVEATIGVDFREKSVDVDGEKLKLQLWDTAGQERFRKSMVQHYYRNAHAVIFMYDVTKASTFHCLPMWIEECNRHQLLPNIPRILVANKCDCTNGIVISTNMAQRFADIHGMPLFETSAKDDTDCDHVDSIFMTLAHKLKNSRPMMPLPYRYSNADLSNSVHDPAFKLSASIDMNEEQKSSCFC